MTSLEFTQSLPTASLLVIDYNALIQRDITEIGKLFQASTELGFFYLKVNNQLLDPDYMFKLAENVFQISLDDNLVYKMDGKNGFYYGYKPVGSMVTDKTGTPDTIEFWNISKDEILIQNETKFPKVILDAKDAVKNFMTKSHEIVLVILEVLSMKLGLHPKALPNLHRLMQSSGDQLRFTKSTMYPIQDQPDVSLGAHTDYGSITILFNRLYGLQVLSTNEEWLYVPPLPGHAIVNLGDALVKLSGGRLKSSTHRVITTPGLKQVTNRYSVVYFSRPENNVLMKNIVNDEDEGNGTVLTVQEWGARRVKNFQTENYMDERTYEMSRGTEGNLEA